MIIDNHPMLRKGLAQRLEREDNLHLVADGYRLKDIDPKEFLESIKRCMNGEPMLSPGLAYVVRSALAQRLPENLHPALPELTDRKRGAASYCYRVKQ